MDIAQIRATLHELAEIPPKDAPFASLYLDMRAGATGLHPGRTFLKSALVRQARRFGPRGDALRSFQADAQRIQEYLDREFDVACQGVAIYACHARGIFQAVPLPVAPENRLTVAQAPRLYQLARLLDDYETYGVVVLSRTRGRVFVVALGKLTQTSELAQSGYQVSKTLAGGWSQANYQRFVQQNVHRFAQEVAAEVQAMCQLYQPERLVLAGETVALTALEEHLSREIAGRVLKITHFDADIPEHKLLAATLPALEAAERGEEASAVERLEGDAAEGDLAVVGTEPTLWALEQGQVDRLVMSRAFVAQGWRCQACLRYGADGVPKACPYCNGAVLGVDLRESMVGAAERSGATVEFVQEVPRLDELGGVGAFLRYPLS